MQSFSISGWLRTIGTTAGLTAQAAEMPWTKQLRAALRAHWLTRNSNVSPSAAIGKAPAINATKSSTRVRQGAGRVTLLGCGPGDPELLTVRAVRVLGEADVLVYDHLVSDAVLDLARPATRRIYVGKQRDKHTLPQAAINQLLVELALQGLRVARLKGGDPFIFGRGGEELEALRTRGFEVDVVPGITAACGIAAATGVPLTHRAYAHSCVFVTGHLRDGTMDLDWEGLARPDQTIVVYMGLHGLAELVRELIAHGLSAATPVMVVSQGTMAGERVLTATLAALPGHVELKEFTPPTLIVIGDVVRLRALAEADAITAAEFSCAD